MTADSSASSGGAGEPDWRLLAQRLAWALGTHRTDMHQTSKRPCATCRCSKAVLDEYLSAISHAQTAVATDEGR